MKQVILILCSCISLGIRADALDKSVQIAGHIQDDFLFSDSFHVAFWQDYIIGATKGGATEFTVYISNKGDFKFQLPMISHAGRLLMYNKKSSTFLQAWQLVEPGDNIFMDISINANHYKIRYSGKGSTKYEVLNKINKEQIDANKIFNFQKRTINLEAVSRFTKQKLATLNSFQKKLSPDIFNIMSADIVGDEFRNLCMLIQSGILDSLGQRLWNPSITMKIDSCVAELLPGLSYPLLSQSKGYIDFLFYKTITELKILEGRTEIDFKDVYCKIETDYSGMIKEKLHAYMFSNHVFLLECGNIESSEFTWFLKSCRDSTNTHYLREAVDEQITTIGRGSPAFEFALEDTNGHVVKLNELRSKVVFVDIWGPNCNACLLFKRNFEDSVYPEIKENPDIVIVSISTAYVKEAWKKDIYRFSNPEFLNLYTNGLGTEHPLIDYYNVNAIPYFLLIDKKGAIFSATLPNIYIRGNAKELLELFKMALN